MLFSFTPGRYQIPASKNLVAGRNFYVADTLRNGSNPGEPGSGPTQSAYMAYILNETAAKSLGFNKPADAVAFTANQRTKEIGIRKVLGASVPNLATLLSREFVGLVVLSANPVTSLKVE